MVLGITAGFSQNWINLELPELSGLTNGETVVIPVTATDVIMPNEMSSFYIYVEWDDAVLDFVSAELSPEMIVNLGMWNILFGTGNASDEGIETCVGGWLNTVNGSTFSMLPGDVFFNITATYVGDGSEVLGVGATELNFQFEAKDVGGKLTKGMTEIIDADFVLFDLIYDVPAGSVNIPSGPTETMWTGAVNNNWFEAGNWNPLAVPGAGDDVVIANVSAKAPFPTISGSAATGALTLMPGAQLNIAALADLTTHGLFTNGGTFVIESNGITNPGIGESGSYIDLGGIAPGGAWEFQRDITNSTPYGTPVGWHFISSPLPAGEFTSDDLYYYYVNWFNNVTQQYVPIEGDPVIPCTPATTVANGLMEGWSIKYDDQYAGLCAGGVDDWVVNMMGTSFNTGAQAAAFGPLWGLMGNPYPSAIDPDLVGWPVGLNTNTAYMWDGSANSWVLGANGLGQNIPPAQGFFVDGLAGGTFALTGAERIHDTFQWWMKSSSDLLKLHATVEGADNYADAYIRFNQASTTGLDKQWDATKRYAGAVTPELYTTTGGLELALNTQPETDMVPMSFVCGTAGTYTIEAIETGTFAYVVLEDLVSGEQTNLLEDAYTFDYTNVEEVRNFIVHFALLGVGELNANNVKIWALENNIIVNVAANVTGEIAVYNMMGQEIIRTEIESVETQIPVSDVNVNYVVKVISDNNAVTGKVYVK